MYNLLIVDDERLERIALKMYFEENIDACQVCHEAKNGHEALELIAKNAYDIVLMDIRMPGEDGLVIAKQVKKDHPETAVIMLTAYAEFDYAQRAVKIHADDYLLKPSRPETIAGTISNVLSKRKMTVQKPQHSPQAEAFVKELISAHYLESCISFDKYIETRTGKMEVQKADIKLILEGFLRLIEHYELDMNEANVEKIKNIKHFYHDNAIFYNYVHEIMSDLFYEIIEKKLCRHSREIDFALDYIEYKLKNKLSLDMIAKYMNISSQYFSRYFKKEIGITFVQYLSERRIALAQKEIMYTDKSFGDIAFELCFNEANYFSKVFKKHTDMTPSEFKDNIQLGLRDAGGQNQYVVSRSWMI